MADATLPTPADIIATANRAFPPGPPDPIQACTNVVTWIEVQMLDVDGNPIGGEQYIIIAPDQKRYEGVLDANGLVRVDGLQPGTCSISFPGLDRTSWQRL